MEDKLKGGLMGLAIGDALGGTTEFMTEQEIKETYGRLTEIIGGGVWGLDPGETTDDTAMTMCVAKGILEKPENPISAIGTNFLKWFGTKPKDVGIIISTVMEMVQGENWFETAEYAHYHLLNEKSAGNGTLMRCLPIAGIANLPLFIC